MTKNKTAICTPTATREEFESILRELDGVGVKWSNGEKPSDIGWKKEKRYLAYRSDGIRWGFVPVGEQLPRAEFISAIKRDFGQCEHEWIFNVATYDETCLQCGADRELHDPAISKMETTGKEKPKMKIYTEINPDVLVVLSEQLEKKSIVEWCGGDKPTIKVKLGFNNCLAFNYGDNGALSHGTSGLYSDSLEKVTNKEFVDRIVEKFPKEQPKMNYNKMTKAELIDALDKRGAEISELRAKWTEQDEALNYTSIECGKLKRINGELLEDTKRLEQSNAEQAETIRGLETELDDLQSVYNNCSIAANEGARLVADLREENTRIKRHAAQILCPDVLEGK